MCAVSMVYDSYRQYPQYPSSLGEPQPLPWTRDSLDEFKQIIKRLDDLDKKLGIPPCHDPAKAEWVKDIEARLDRLEKQRGS